MVLSSAVWLVVRPITWYWLSFLPRNHSSPSFPTKWYVHCRTYLTLLFALIYPLVFLDRLCFLWRRQRICVASCHLCDKTKADERDCQHWRIQGRGPGGPALSPLFLDQTEAPRAEKIFFGDRPLPPYLKVWIRHWPGWGYIPGGIHSIDQFRYIEIHTWLWGLWNKTKEIILRLRNEKSQTSNNVHLSTTAIALQRPPFLANSPYNDSCLNLSTAINSLQWPLSSASWRGSTVIYFFCFIPPSQGAKYEF